MVVSFHNKIWECLSLVLQRPAAFFILTFFKLFIKLTPGQHYLHSVTLLVAPARVGHCGDVGLGLPRHMQRRGRAVVPPHLAWHHWHYSCAAASLSSPTSLSSSLAEADLIRR
jgi:hypothetical protein